MKKKILFVCAVALCIALPLVALGLGSVLNTITFRGKIVPPEGSMTSIALEMGNMTANSIGGSGPSQNGTLIDTFKTLTLSQPTNVTLAFANVSDLSPFEAFQTTIVLYQNNSPTNSGSISNSTTTFTMMNVAQGTFEIWMAWTYAAGPTPANVTITVTVSI
jgi:hypothetical protein